MSCELLLMRHGKSDWDAGTDDFRRPLKSRGKRAAQQIGTWLLQQGLLPDHIVSSPARRALDTAHRLSRVLGLNITAVHEDDRIYHASVDDLLDVLHDCPAEAQRVLLIGHNPAAEDLLLQLVSEKDIIPEDGKLLPTAALARLQLACAWSSLTRDCAQLVSTTRPSQLPKTFPYPAPHGSGQRERPAYYYTQSGVIPYRVKDGRLEILVIASNKKKHWVLPKGIQDPGMSAQESAAREALEEAGALGEVDAQSLGRYTYEKWGAECTVDVFPMRVSELIEEADWDESHRGRQWLKASKAADKLKQAALAPMIENLAQRLRIDL